MLKVYISSGIIALIIIGIGALFLINYGAPDKPAAPANNTLNAPAPSPTPEISVITPTQSASAPTTTPANQPASSPAASTTAPASLELKEFAVTGQDFSFAPNRITVKKGENVKITFKNTGGFHDLVIDELGIQTDRINDGGEDSVEFIANKTGSFAYYCSVGNHRSLGMEGMLIVE